MNINIFFTDIYHLLIQVRYRILYLVSFQKLLSIAPKVQVQQLLEKNQLINFIELQIPSISTIPNFSIHDGQQKRLKKE